MSSWLAQFVDIHFLFLRNGGCFCPSKNCSLTGCVFHNCCRELIWGSCFYLFSCYVTCKFMQWMNLAMEMIRLELGNGNFKTMQWMSIMMNTRSNSKNIFMIPTISDVTIVDECRMVAKDIVTRKWGDWLAHVQPLLIGLVWAILINLSSITLLMSWRTSSFNLWMHYASGSQVKNLGMCSFSLKVVCTGLIRT